MRGDFKIVHKINKKEATRTSMAFSLRHPDLNILISFPKFGILDQTHLLSILIHEKHSRGIFFFFYFYSQLLKRAVYF